MAWMSASLTRSAAGMRVLARDDIDVLPAPHDVEALQLQAAVADTGAGFEIVFVAMPGADEMHILAEALAVPGAIGAEHVLDLVHHHAFAGRAALMQAQVFIGIKLAFPMEHADLAAVVAHDAAFAVGKPRDLVDKDFRHSSVVLLVFVH